MYREQTADLGPAPAASQLNIAVIGSGISGLSAAWLLGKRHRVTLFEADRRIGGHSHTVDAGGVEVDTGFIVFNRQTYPNLTALLAHLGLESQETEMSFAVSLGSGRQEYSGSGLKGLFAQKRNVLRPRFWKMLGELLRFYREAPHDLAELRDENLEEYLDRRGYGKAFRMDHLYPMAAAIWSSPAADMRDYPAASFIKFCRNHNLLSTGKRPPWHTVAGGSRSYVEALLADFSGTVRTGSPVSAVHRGPVGVRVETAGGAELFDHVVIAAHADQALDMLADPDAAEQDLLGKFRYSRNETVLHSDPALMPRRRKVWSAWNFMAGRDPSAPPAVTYWMNRLQHLETGVPMLVTLNPQVAPDPALVHWQGTYHHPIMDSAAVNAQRDLWSLQGRRNTWFCGAWFGAGFHEDGLQAGLAVAEQLGGACRPWQVGDPSGRIFVCPQVHQPA
ncbi:MAG: NAD(P)/FAD-dependent oxidoreductase [Novosphingobium sp.]